VLHALGVFDAGVVRERGGWTMLFCSAPAAAAYEALRPQFCSGIWIECSTNRRRTAS